MYRFSLAYMQNLTATQRRKQYSRWRIDGQAEEGLQKVLVPPRLGLFAFSRAAIGRS